MDLPQKIASKRILKFIIGIDEFQKISEWEDKQQMLELLRVAWAKSQPEVSHCLYGSKRHLITTLFSNSSQPFYRFGETIYLTKVDKKEWKAFSNYSFFMTCLFDQPTVL